MPQPLSRVRRVRSITWGPLALDSRPNLAALIMRHIATWSQTEILLGGILAIVLRLEQAIAFAGVQMYLRLSSAEARRSVLDAAAKAMLATPDYELFSLTMRAIKPVRSRRNDFAHGFWGITDELPDALLWVAADDQLTYDTTLLGAHPQNLQSPYEGLLTSAIDAFDRHQESIMVYRMPDLSDDLSRAREATLAVNLLWEAFHPYGRERDAKRQELRNLHLIQAVLQSESTDESTPKAPS